MTKPSADLVSAPAPSVSVLAVIVLYKMQAEQSQSFRALRHLLENNPELSLEIELMICDNTPYEQARPVDFTGHYRSDTSNPGLASCYNLALSLAVRRNLPWLLLFDQDTTPTLEYLRELLQQSKVQLDQPDIVALVPKLVQRGTVQSPHTRPTFRHPRFDEAFSGKAPDRLYAFNSGSLLRVSAMQAIGGFPEEFWLDFLDHATFHQLQRQEGRLYVLCACLEHDLSANSVAKRDDAGRRRYQNILDAEYAFYREYGSACDRFYLRARLLRGALGQLIKRRNPGECLQMLRAAMRR